MEEIKVNDYVRTDKGEIAKVSSLFKGDIMGAGFLAVSMNTEPYTYGNIIKYSPNIIDLIEVADYVNGYRLEKYDGRLVMVCINELGWAFIPLENIKIKSIVTHEQFNSIKYEVE